MITKLEEPKILQWAVEGLESRWWDLHSTQCSIRMALEDLASLDPTRGRGAKVSREASQSLQRADRLIGQVRQK